MALFSWNERLRCAEEGTLPPSTPDAGGSYLPRGHECLCGLSCLCTAVVRRRSPHALAYAPLQHMSSSTSKIPLAPPLPSPKSLHLSHSPIGARYVTCAHIIAVLDFDCVRKNLLYIEGGTKVAIFVSLLQQLHFVCWLPRATERAEARCAVAAETHAANLGHTDNTALVRTARTK